ncbi:MAG: metallophosphoesterase [Armatimonadetes bacterium]|nr:metallophosphoesterase [Armatimonadota bacterium]
MSKPKRALKTTGLAAAGALAYGALVAPRRVQVHRYSVALAGLPPACAGLRVVQISDLHLSPLFRERALRRVVRLANALEPDAIVLTGDFASYHSLPSVIAYAPGLAHLRAPLGTFACLGNHDYWEGAAAIRRAIGAAGVRVLVNESLRLREGLWLAAVDDLMSGRPDLARAAAGIPDDDAVILLSHNPTVLPQVADRPWLVLAGHTHGGQLALPFLGPRGTMRIPGIRHFAFLYEASGCRVHGGCLESVATHRYPAGWYREGRALLYVSRGVGTGEAFPVRLNCRPEIARFTLIRRKDEEPE